MKLKLVNGYDSRLLFDILVDFPVPIILSRKGLLEYVLDCVGTGITMSESDQPVDLSPADALAWLTQLFEKALSAFKLQMDGSLCSTVPKSHDEEVSDTSSYSSQLAISMYKVVLNHSCDQIATRTHSHL